MLGEAEGYVEVLHGLAGAAFDEVVYGARDDYGAVAVGGGVEVAEVGMPHHHDARGVHQTDEVLASPDPRAVQGIFCSLA